MNICKCFGMPVAVVVAVFFWSGCAIALDAPGLSRLRPGATLARNGCVPTSRIRDGDVHRNAQAIARAGLCITTAGFTERGTAWRFVIIENPQRPDGPIWYLPHDNETQAFDSAIYAVATYGGRMVAVAGGETRNYEGVDPNRHFGTSAADVSPCALGRPTPLYTGFVMDQFAGQRFVLTIHNNTNGGSVSAAVNSGKSTGYRVRTGNFSDPDNLIYIASVGPIDSNPSAVSLRDTLMANGLNVVYENVSRGNSDCSLSNHVALNDGRPYLNVEAEHGDPIQVRMVDAVMFTLGYRPL